MRRDTEPPDWALPAWDALDIGARPAARPGPGRPAGTSGSAGPSGPAGPFGIRILGVTEVTRAVRETLREDPRLGDLWVEGEVGRVTVSSAGHAYFTLRDEKSQLACVFFREDRQGSAFEPQSGMRVVVHGRIDVFDAQGVYQCYVSAIQPAGFGDLALRFEQTKARLAAEGLFDATAQAAASRATGDDRGRHQPLRRGDPRHPARAGPALAARRGRGERLPRPGRRGRGDRSWPPSDASRGTTPRAARAADRTRRRGSSSSPAAAARWRTSSRSTTSASSARSRPIRCPVVSGIGHETDVTLADFVADLRAPTPSAAAELVVPDRLDVVAALRARRSAPRRGGDARGGGLGAAGRGGAARPRGPAAGDAAGGRPRARRVPAGPGDGRRPGARSRSIAGPPSGPRTISGRWSERRLRRERGPARDGVGRARALGPEATLARGYAIVRRRGGWGDRPRSRRVAAGTRLRLRVAGVSWPGRRPPMGDMRRRRRMGSRAEAAQADPAGRGRADG